MWALINGEEYVNVGAIVRLVEDRNGRAELHLVDGTKVNIDQSIDDITLSTGTIIAATAGFEAAWLNAMTGKVETENVAGWRCTGTDDPLIPMVVSGRMHSSAVLFPDRRVLDRTAGSFYPDLDSWVAMRVEMEQRKAKVCHSIAESASNN